MSTKTLITVEEFAAMKTADTEQYELVNGELVPLSSPTPKHVRIHWRTILRSSPQAKSWARPTAACPPKSSADPT